MEKLSLCATELSTSQEMDAYLFLLFIIMCRKKEEIGVFPISRSGRDCHFYVLDVLRNNIEKCVSLVAESVLCPKLLDEDIAEVQVVHIIICEAILICRISLTMKTKICFSKTRCTTCLLLMYLSLHLLLTYSIHMLVCMAMTLPTAILFVTRIPTCIA